jgi:glucose/arabinose dehydrogenase
LIFEIPVTNTSEDYSGRLETGPDNHLYLTIRGLNRDGFEPNVIENRGLQNSFDEPFESNYAILRIASNGTISSSNPFSQNEFKGYFAYGIRQVSDLMFDPVSKNLWDIEKGPNSIDEINMIKSGFNNGWKKSIGHVNNSCCSGDGKLPQETKGWFELLNSHYDEPKLVISNSSNLKAIGFMNVPSSNLYRDDKLYVGDMQGNLYQFGLDKDRENIFSSGDIQNNLFAKDFGPIVDLEFDDNGVLYVLTYSNTTSSPYKEQSGSVYAIPLKDGFDRLTTNEIIVVDSFGIIWILILITLLSVALRYEWFKRVIKK